MLYQLRTVGFDSAQLLLQSIIYYFLYIREDRLRLGMELAGTYNWNGSRKPKYIKCFSESLTGRILVSF